MKSYFASLIPVTDCDGGYICLFKDFPEAFTQGADIEDAIEMAEDVLRIWAEEYKPVGTKELPTPSRLRDALAFAEEEAKSIEHFDAEREIIHQLIKVPNLSTKPVRINISFPANILEQIDKKANSLGLTRSKLLANGALAYEG